MRRRIFCISVLAIFIFSLSFSMAYALGEELGGGDAEKADVGGKSELVDKILEEFQITHISDKARATLDRSFNISLKNDWFAKWYSNVTKVASFKVQNEPTRFADVYVVNNTGTYNYTLIYYPSQRQMVLFVKSYIEDTSENVVKNFKNTKGKSDVMKFKETDTYAYYGKKKTFGDYIYHTYGKSGLVQIMSMIVIDIE